MNIAEPRVEQVFSYKKKKMMMLPVIKERIYKGQQFTTFDDDGEEIVLVTRCSHISKTEWTLPFYM